jgi:plasmid stabilization system protein ParE
MAQKPIRWAYAARADLLEALEHIVEESPQAAKALLQEVEAAAVSLGTFPERGTRVREVIAADLRQVLVGRYS